MSDLTCLVCQKVGPAGSVVNSGWRLAPNRIGGYTCSPTCDDVITTYVFDENGKFVQVGIWE